MTEKSQTAQKILAYTDPRKRMVDFCDQQVLVVAPPLGAVKTLIKLVPKMGSETRTIKIEDLIDSAPDLIIDCVRELDDQKQHVFQDTPENRKALQDVPQDDAIRVVNTVLELMAMDRKVLEAEVKN